MENMFLLAGIISVAFFICKFLEMRYIDEEAKPLKVLIRDSLLVYVTVIFGVFIIDQLNPVIDTDASTTSMPLAFTDNPPF